MRKYERQHSQVNFNHMYRLRDPTRHLTEKLGDKMS